MKNSGIREELVSKKIPSNNYIKNNSLIMLSSGFLKRAIFINTTEILIFLYKCIQNSNYKVLINNIRKLFMLDIIFIVFTIFFFKQLVTTDNFLKGNI